MTYYYGYGAARLQLAMPYARRMQAAERAWLFHPSLLGLLASLVVLWLSRSCVITTPGPGRTVLWLQEVPKTIAPERYDTVPVVRRPLEPPAPEQPEAQKKPVLPPAKPKEMKPPELVMKKKPEPLHRQIARMPEKFIPAPSAAPRHIDSRHQADTEKKQYRLADKLEIPKPDTSLHQLKKQDQATPVNHEAVRRDAVDFRPIAPAPAVGQPLKKSDTDNDPRSRHTILATGDRQLPVGHDAPARSIASAESSANRDDRRMFALPDRTGLSTGTAPVGNAPDRLTSSQPEEAETIRIIGTVTGESMRIENLKRTIFRKAELMDRRYSPYCCTIKGMVCKLVLGGRQPVLSFSESVIPFEVISKLERRLPEGMTACTE